MAAITRLKTLAERLPEPVGRATSRLPFSLRLGPAYARAAAEIAAFEQLSDDEREQRLFEQRRAMVVYAARHIPFYRAFYAEHGFDTASLREPGDWQRVPVVTKADMQQVAFVERCRPGARGMKINTGGTSGAPLEFMLDGRAFAREWAHMHAIWKARGYAQTHLKLTLRGHHFAAARPLSYNAVHNELVVNANSPMARVVAAVLALPASSTLRWVHGYPSLVAEFASALDGQAGAGRFRERLYGVLLGSEYPAPIYRDAIERGLSNNVVAWYGHSEMALLAPERARGRYQSMPTYGYAEALPSDEPGRSRLIATGLHNAVHPFLRYDTGDLVQADSAAGGRLEFSIAEGRIGDFVVDRNGQRHSLTAIIFGRHHPGFEQVEHLQVRDDGEGRATLLAVPRSSAGDVHTIAAGFDFADLAIEWRYELLDAPLRTPAGKIRLKIS